MKKYYLIIVVLIYFTALSFGQTYQVDNIITGLNHPIAFEFMPNGNIILTQQTGAVKVYNPSGQQISLFWNFSDSCFSSGEMGTLGIVLDPNYINNRNIYVYYVKGNAFAFDFKIIKFTESNNLGTNPVEIFTYHNGSGSGNSHAAGNLHFGADGKLYFTVGEYGCTAQDLTCPRGKILRINSDGSIPSDNPFYNVGNDDGRIWAYGLRNSFDFCFSPINDSIYATENSNGGDDEMNLIKKGKNYGWPFCEGYCSPHNPLYIDPIGLSQRPDVGTTGIIIYNGSQLPELNGKLLYSSASTGKVFLCTLGNQPHNDTIISKSLFWTFTNDFVVTMKQEQDGYIYATLYSSGTLIRIKHYVNGIISNSLHENFSLEQNYPNPFNPATSISFTIPKENFVSLKIYDVLGKEVQTLVNGNKVPGDYKIKWDASNFPSGVYFYKLTVNNQSIEKKMVLIK